MMMQSRYYKVAGLLFKVTLPEKIVLEVELSKYIRFACEVCDSEVTQPMFEIQSVTTNLADEVRQGAVRIDERKADYGYTRIYEKEGYYYSELCLGNDSHVYYMKISPDFKSYQVYVDSWDDLYAMIAFDTFIRIAYSQSCILNGAVSLHSSVVALEEKGYLFLGKSGTGKSTHSRMWIKSFEDARLLNDDNPIIRLIGDEVWVYGSPWSGKTHCYVNRGVRVGGIVRLVQGIANDMSILTGSDAFLALLVSCSSLKANEKICNSLFGTISKIQKKVPIGRLLCRPEMEAAMVCKQCLDEKKRAK